VSIAASLPSLATMLEPANVIGTIALGATCTWPLLRQRRAILMVQVVGAILFALHYLLLGSPTAAAMCALGVVQGLAVMLLPRREWRIAAVAATVVVSMGATAATWTGIASLFSQLGGIAGAAGRLQADTQRLRLLFLVSVGFWCTHNLLVGSVFGLFADGLSVTGLVLGLWRNRARGQPAVAPHAAAAAA
jgi:hypothetical protein